MPFKESGEKNIIILLINKKTSDYLGRANLIHWGKFGTVKKSP